MFQLFNVVNLLVNRRDVKTDSVDNHGRTPLSWAAENGRLDVVKLLVDREDVDADSEDHLDRTPWHWARQNCHGAVADLLERLHEAPSLLVSIE